MFNGASLNVNAAACLLRFVPNVFRPIYGNTKLGPETAVDALDTQLPQQPTKPRSTSRTLSGTAKLLLDVLQCVSGDVPFTGLGAVVGGLQVLFGQYEKLTENNAEIEDLHQNLERLRKYIEPIKDDIPESFKEFLTINLAPDIAIITDDINAEIDKVKKPSVLVRYFSAAHDAKAIAELARRVNSMFADIMMQIHRMTLRVTMENKINLDTITPQVDAIHRQLVRDKLIEAQNALPDSFGRKACHSGTRSTVLKSIEDWLTTDTSPQVFCLSGQSGSGKSTVAVTIFQEILGIGTDIRFAGFFCSSTFDNASNPKYIFPTLAGQLCQCDDIIYSILEPMLGQQDPTCGSGKTQFEKLLISPLGSVKGTTLLVIDGLDECKGLLDDAFEVLNTLLINVSRVTALKVLISSRSNSPIFEQLFSKVSENPSGYRCFSLDDDVSLPELRHDLRLLLAVELKTRGFSQKDIISLQNVINNANCSFFVALTACEELFSPFGDSSKQADNFKDLLSRGTNKIYKSVTERALSVVDSDADHGERRRGLYAGLVMVAFGQDSLSLVELALLLAIPIDELRCFFSGFPENILSVKDETVLILHSSFQDHLKSGQSAKPNGSDCMHLYITRLLFRSMNNHLHRHISGPGGFRLHANTTRQSPRKDGKITADLSYACRYWPEHLVMINMSTAEGESQSLFFILQEFFRAHLLHWLEVLAALGEMDRIASALNILLKWIKMWQDNCDSRLRDHSSLEGIVSDALKSFTLFCTAIKSSPHQVYHSFLLPWTPSGRRLAELYCHVEASITVAEVTCHRRQLITIEPSIDNAQEPLNIKLSQDASRVAVVKNERIEIGENAKDTFEVFLDDSGSQSYIDALFVGKDNILVTTLSRSSYAEVHLWNVVSKKIEKTLLQQYQATGSKMLPVLVLHSERGTPSLVALLTSSKVKVWEVRTWKERLIIQCRRDQNPQNRLLALSSHHILVGPHLKKLPPSGGITRTLDLNFGQAPRCATFSSDGDTLAIASDTGISLFTHILEGTALKMSPSIVLQVSHQISALALSPVGRYLAATGQSFLWAWKLGDEQPLMKLQNEQKRTVSSVVFSKNGKYLHCAHICAGSRTALFDMRSMEVPISVQMPVTALAMSCSGKIATGSSNGTVTIWDSSMTNVSRYWKRERHPSAVKFVAFSLDGKFIASVSPERVYIRSAGSDLGSNELTQRLPVQSLPESRSYSFSQCVFSGDSSLFLCIMKADTRHTFAQVWQMATWKLLAEFELDSRDYSSDEDIQSISLSQEGDLFAISSRTNARLAVYTLGYNESSICIKHTQRIFVVGRPPLLLSFTLDKKYILSTAGAFDIERGLEQVNEISRTDAFFQDGWIVDSDGQQRCWIPFEEDIRDWASCRSLLVFCTKALGNVVLVGVRPIQ
ncbi:hypothetical protein F5876DRAFT_63227 [Lentinula aff. lateritia]|uniref:Uncharacterized protein n=1 Tax=Lentinula aff. lateritia TaxID=2804960 RepID=A0ACC1U9A8_9AGAR|nr:hypothetical protein F5876DRAFT_63227 [Lentinula aff. lateritia]